MARTTKVSEEGLPAWFDGTPLVACHGGPYARSVEYLSRWMFYRGEGSWYRRGYVPTDRQVPHLEFPAVKCAMLVWDAQRAVAMTDEQWFAALPAATRRGMS